MPKENKSSHLSRRSFAAAAATVTLGSVGGFRSTLAASEIGKINFRVVGTDEPTLIFVHGFACTLEDWDAQVRGLSPRFRCAALDLPGHGGSAMPATVSIATMAEAVNMVKDQTGSRRAILIGHSMGCRVIMEAFQQSPINTVGLVFVDGSFVGGGDPVAAIKKAPPTSSSAAFSCTCYPQASTASATMVCSPAASALRMSPAPASCSPRQSFPSMPSRQSIPMLPIAPMLPRRKQQISAPAAAAA
jgi:pimeloyl-ACP methyl ester carboxylesterase